MKLVGSIKEKINKNKNGVNVARLEITEVVLVHCNFVNNDYQHNSKVLHTFVPDKSFGQLLNISPTNFIFFKFSCIEVWFTNQYFKLLRIEDKLNITSGINKSVKFKNDSLFSLTKRFNNCKRL